MNAPAKARILLAAEGLGKRYGVLPILNDVSFRIQAGEIVTLVGPNGAGKTTLLKLLLGLEKPDAGTITRAEGLRIGYVPQHFAPRATMPLTVAGFMGLMKSLTTPLRGEEQEEVMHELGISHLANHYIHTLSGGERQRMLIAKALLGNPDLLVLDEPVQGVDIAGQSEMYKRIRDIAAARDTAVLMVSHDLFVVMASTHRVICLNGHVCCEGTPLHVGAHPEFVALFGQEVASQLATYAHHHDHHHTLHGEVVQGAHGEGCTHA